MHINNGNLTIYSSIKNNFFIFIKLADRFFIVLGLIAFTVALTVILSPKYIFEVFVDLYNSKGKNFFSKFSFARDNRLYQKYILNNDTFDFSEYNKIEFFKSVKNEDKSKNNKNSDHVLIINLLMNLEYFGLFSLSLLNKEFQSLSKYLQLKKIKYLNIDLNMEIIKKVVNHINFDGLTIRIMNYIDNSKELIKFLNQNKISKCILDHTSYIDSEEELFDLINQTKLSFLGFDICSFNIKNPSTFIKRLSEVISNSSIISLEIIDNRTYYNNIAFSGFKFKGHKYRSFTNTARLSKTFLPFNVSLKFSDLNFNKLNLTSLIIPEEMIKIDDLKKLFLKLQYSNLTSFSVFPFTSKLFKYYIRNINRTWLLNPIEVNNQYTLDKFYNFESPKEEKYFPKIVNAVQKNVDIKSKMILLGLIFSSNNQLSIPKSVVMTISGFLFSKKDIKRSVLKNSLYSNTNNMYEVSSASFILANKKDSSNREKLLKFSEVNDEIRMSTQNFWEDEVDTKFSKSKSNKQKNRFKR